ncbi:MAG: efflux RND transporter permease subunit [Ignavibacteria bacterium]|nr:efflux RND transporter permease subunit [Ignavibacteria bacterium]
MNFFKKIYLPLLEFVLRKKAMTVCIALIFLIISLISFTKLGGEFIPKLDEGILHIR